MRPEPEWVGKKIGLGSVRIKKFKDRKGAGFMILEGMGALWAIAPECHAKLESCPCFDLGVNA